MAMQWTLELNDLLNQCVFECGYEFANACGLLQSRARTLRLLPECECALTADACQVQWMTINPMDDECEYDARDDSDASDCLSAHQLVIDARSSDSNANDAALPAAADSEISALKCDAKGPPAEPTPTPSASPTSTNAQSPHQASAYPLYECAPLLELSISDAELDLLISSLPPPSSSSSSSRATMPEDDDSSADAKHQTSAPTAAAASEMQWVLSFLTDPDDAAQHDAEAKRLIQPLDKREDDNYQYFLQELRDANLLLQQRAPEASRSSDGHVGKSTKLETRSVAFEAHAYRDVESATAAVGALHVHDATTSSADTDDEEDLDSDSNDEEDDDWEVVRRSIKTHVANRSPGAKQTAAMSLVKREGLPPPAPTRFTRPRGAPNGATASGQSQSQRIALSREIGDFLQTHGAFQFPKRLFPHHNDSALEQHQQPELM